MGTINAIKGLIRLWLVGSIGYVGAVLYSGSQAVHAEFMKPVSPPPAAKISVKKIPVFCDEARGVSGRDFKVIKKGESDPLQLHKPLFKQNNPISGKSVCQYTVNSFRALYPEYDGYSDRDLETMATEKTSGFKVVYTPPENPPFNPPQPWKMLGDLIWRALMYPLIAMISLIAVYWIYAGFIAGRKSNKSYG